MRWLTALTVLSSLSAGALAAETPERIRELAKREFGDRFGGLRGEKKVSKLVASVCRGCEFHRVLIKSTRPLEPGMPSGLGHHRLNYLAVGPKHAVAVRTPKDVVRFLDGLRIPVKNDLGALERCFVFAELTGGKLRTAIPRKKSLFRQYQQQKQDDWDLKLSGTVSGWDIALTLEVDRGIEYCVRYRLRIERAGAISITNHRVVYTYTMYE